MNETVNILGVELHNLSRTELLERLRAELAFNPNVDVITWPRAAR